MNTFVYVYDAAHNMPMENAQENKNRPSLGYKMKTAPKNRSGVTGSRDVDSHVSGTLQAESRD